MKVRAGSVDKPRVRRATILSLVWLALACRPEPRRPPAAPVDERGELTALILTLDEVAPCLTDAGAAAVRLVDAQLAGEAATTTFVCANGAVRGRVTFFRIAGTWKVSTKEIRRVSPSAPP